MSTPIRLGKRTVGKGHKPFIIAELSGNHNQSLDRAMEIVEASHWAGADAVKLQTYTSDTMTLDCDKEEFQINDKNSLWYGKNLYQLYKEAYTPWEWHEPIMKKCEELGMEFFSTPFDHTAVNFLEELGVTFYKIASFENTCIPLLKQVAAIGKPMIISTGMASVKELDETVKTCRDSGCDDLILLKCTSNYPADPVNAHINTIPHMRELFNVEVGLSDHTLGSGVPVASTALGGCVIEKHLTLKRADGGVDSAFSMEPQEFKTMVEEVERAWHAMGEVRYSTGSEQSSKAFRRTVYVAKDIKKGETFTQENLRCVRPGFGLPTNQYELVLGKKANRDLEFGTAMKIDFVDFAGV